MSDSPTIYAVFGSPVLHSKSPQLFAPLLNQEREYYHRIRPRSANDLVSIIRRAGIRGASVTAPFKEELVSLADEITPQARTIGAVNCLFHTGGVLRGHNTDHYGVTGPLQEAGVALNSSRILVLGAGGAARAAAYGLVQAGAVVDISNRTHKRAKRLAWEFGCSVIPWDTRSSLPGYDAVVSTILPEGLPPYVERLNYGLLLDAIYKPSRMTKYSRQRGITVLGGERWLVHQGVHAAAFYVGRSGTPALLASRLDNIPDRDVLRVLVLDQGNAGRLSQGQYDLVVSGSGENEDTINHWINEEHSLVRGR